MKRLLIAVLLLPLFIQCSSAETTAASTYQMICKYISQQYSIPIDIVYNMDAYSVDDADEGKEEWEYTFSLFSQELFDVGGCDDSVRYCRTSTWYTEQQVQEGIDYLQAVYPSVIALREWEKKYGPYQLWGVEKNALFYSEYNNIPGETKGLFEQGTAHWDMPSDTDIPIDNIMAQANTILMEHLHISEETISSFYVGASFYKDKAEDTGYLIQYYSMDNNKFQLMYRVQILSPTGVCYSAHMYLEDGAERPEIDDLSYIYYSDIYTYINSRYRSDIFYATTEPTAADTVLYYDPEAGTRYHTRPDCIYTGVVLPLSAFFQYSQINEEPYCSLRPCTVCNAPDR